MKKKSLFVFFAFFCFFSFAFAELYDPWRHVEIAINAGFGVSNNHVGVLDLMQENLVLDLKDFCDDIPKQGWAWNADLDAGVALNLNFKKFRFSFYTGAVGTLYFGIPKNLFEYILKGNAGKNDVIFKPEYFCDVYEETLFSFFKKFRGFGVTFGIGFYTPLVHLVPNQISAQAKTFDDFSIQFNSNLEFYSAFSLNSIEVDQIVKSLKNMGFEISGMVERQVFDSLDVGGFLQIPIIPGRLTHKSKKIMTFNMRENFLSSFGGDEESISFESDSQSVEESGIKYKIFRPFKFGAELAWRPFGRWFTIRAMGALVFRYPYSKQVMFYPEYLLGVEISIFRVLGFCVQSSYFEKIFQQSVGLTIDGRILCLEVLATVQGASFIKTFRGVGAGAKIALKMGW